MDRNVDRCQIEFDDTLNIFVLHVCQCYIITLQKGQPGIIILKIERFTHARRHLVNKTENALIAAGFIITHQTIFKVDAQILVIVFDFQLPQFSVCLFKKHQQMVTVEIIFIIKNIFYFISIDPQQAVARLDL